MITILLAAAVVLLFVIVAPDLVRQLLGILLLLFGIGLLLGVLLLHWRAAPDAGAVPTAEPSQQRERIHRSGRG
jgi:hypothetical protein